MAKKNRRYPAEFRARVVHEALACGSTWIAARNFGVPQSTVHYWTSRARERTLSDNREEMRLDRLLASETKADPENPEDEQLAPKLLENGRMRFYQSLLTDLASDRLSARDKLRALEILSDMLEKLSQSSTSEQYRGQLDRIAEALERPLGVDGE